MGKKPRWVEGVLLAAALATLSVWAIQPKRGQADEPAAPVKLGEKSVTVFPVVITPNKGFGTDFRKRIAEVVGMLLERADMKDVRLAETEFLPKEGDTVNQVAGDFGKFVAGQKVETPYALFSEILGERKKGIEAIRTVVVDAKGNVVLAEETPADSGPEFPKDPMGCCVFVVNRLRGPWGLEDPLREGAPNGKIQENWRKKSGLPSDAEVAAMKRRAVKLREGLSKSSLQICPAYAFGKPDAETPGKLAALLADVGFKSVKAVENGPDLNVPGSPNEQEVLWRTARKVRAYFQHNAPVCEYVLVADFLMGRAEGKVKVGAVHWFLCDQQGEWVMVDFQNSHHGDFQRIDPDSVEDCLELVKVRLKNRLSGAN